MGEVVTVNCNSGVIASHGRSCYSERNSGVIADSFSRDLSFNGSTKSFDSFRMHSINTDSPTGDQVIVFPSSSLHWPGRELNPHDAWLPITESRNGSVFSTVFHLLCSGIGYQALILPVAFATLGWAWGIICLSLAFLWQLYTIWLLVNLHECADSGVRYSRYIHLSVTAFGEKLGKLLAIFPVMYLSGGTCAMLIINAGGAMQLFYRNLCGDGADAICDSEAVSGAQWFLVFTCIAILVAQLPNLNSITGVSLIGAITAITYTSILWAISISIDRPNNISYQPLQAEESGMDKFGSIFNAVGIILLSFKGHNVILEIQATLPSSPKHSSHKTMWAGVIVSYLQIAMCLFPLAIAGFWAHGNKIPADGGMLRALSEFHRHDISKFVMGLIYLLVIINGISAFQIHAMIVFDTLELRYTSIRKQRCATWVRTAIRLLFGGLVYLISVAFPFLGSLAPLIGGLTMPLTYAYPCFMWISIKKPRQNGAMWFVNIGLGCLGLILCVLLVISATWNLADKGLNANFFNP